MNKTINICKHFRHILSKHLLKRYLNRNVCFGGNVCLDNNIRIAVVGSGPSGFYTTQQLIKNQRVYVDIYEKYPVPFGLVRFGVAPDHQSVKNVINSFTTTANNKRVSFIGNVGIGSDSDITLQEIRDNYHCVVLCYGAAQDKTLNIEGEDLPNVISARRFVGWYNGVPNDRQLEVDLNCETAVIIGHGNVAIDCARILLLSDSQHILSNTDITNHSLEKLMKSRIRNVYIIGRRGPMQVSFTIKEFRELTKLENCKTIVSSEECDSIPQSIIESLDRPKRRLTEFIVKVSKENSFNVENTSKQCFIRFLRNPKLIKGNQLKGVSSLVLAKNQFKSNENIFDKNANVMTTEELEEINCGLVLRSIGYKAVSIDPSLPLDRQKGTILNENGRVVGCGPDLYCSGWAASGAHGVILNTMNASIEVAKNILQDIDNKKLDLSQRNGSKNILTKLKSNGVKVIHFDDWKRIDRMEQQLGSTLGKPREKIVDIKQMLEIIDNKS